MVLHNFCISLLWACQNKHSSKFKVLSRLSRVIYKLIFKHGNSKLQGKAKIMSMGGLASEALKNKNLEFVLNLMKKSQVQVIQLQTVSFP